VGIELALLGVVGSFILGGGIGALLNHAYRAPEVIEVMVPYGSFTAPVAVGSEHTHEYNHLVEGKWACAWCEALRPEVAPSPTT
jgi:hypothetical protein